MTRTHALFSLMAATLWAGTAAAVDGVLEINETCAALAGCFSGDTAGYPVTIDGSAGGSYRLTSNLIVPDENTDGIVVSTPSVTLDLNGFEIVRSGCEGAYIGCTPASGTGIGIALQNSSSYYRGMVVKNGNITGMGSAGVHVGESSTVTGLHVRWCRSLGIGANEGSTVEGNIVDGSETGIIAFGASRVQRNVVTNFTLSGIFLQAEGGYGDNVVKGSGTTISGGVNMGGNVCNGSATCP
jgi:hypothetical protein